MSGCWSKVQWKSDICWPVAICGDIFAPLFISYTATMCSGSFVTDFPNKLVTTWTLPGVCTKVCAHAWIGTHFWAQPLGNHLIAPKSVGRPQRVFLTLRQVCLPTKVAPVFIPQHLAIREPLYRHISCYLCEILNLLVKRGNVYVFISHVGWINTFLLLHFPTFSKCIYH